MHFCDVGMQDKGAAHAGKGRRWVGGAAGVHTSQRGSPPPVLCYAVLCVLCRPEHVQVADILVYATNQCSAKGIARVLLDEE